MIVRGVFGRMRKQEAEIARLHTPGGETHLCISVLVPEASGRTMSEDVITFPMRCNRNSCEI